MKKTFILLTSILLLNLVSCKEKSTKEKFQDAIESAGENVEEAAEETGEKTERGINKLKKKLED